MSLSFRLRIRLPNGRQKTVVLKKQETIMGRDSACDVKLNDPEISRRHAVLKIPTAENITIADLGSSNGTYLRNSPITQETRIAPGTIIRMGNTYVSIETIGGLTVEAVELTVTEAEYQPFHSLIQMQDDTGDMHEHRLFDLCSDLVSSGSGLRNVELLLNRIADVMHAENGMIILDPKRANGERAIRVTRGETLVIPENVMNTVMESGKCFIYPTFIMTAPDNPVFTKETASALCVPLMDERVIRGVIYLDRGKQIQPFSQMELRRLCRIGQVSAASLTRELEFQNLNRRIEGFESERKRWFNAITTKGEPPIPTRNKKFQQLLFVAMRIGRTDRHTLLIGQPGTGRTLIAQRMHTFSDRCNAPFISLDTHGPSRDLFSELLFGSEDNDRVTTGLLAQAHGGTLFIREITALPVDIQKRLTEALSNGLFTPEGGSQKIATSVRLIAATDVDHRACVADHSFYPGLMELIAESSLEIPSLGERPEDILPLARHYLRQYLPSNRPVMEFAAETAELLIRYSWPGNLDELEDCMRYTASVCIEERVHIGDLPLRVREQPAQSVPENLNLREQMDILEKNLIRIALERHDQIVTRAAKDLGLSESTLRYRMQRLNIRM
ncbi:sigma 54-interacting transcriptional regulator [bacterium]|nr:sigma 54-interacting transcriptional regulator [candidate division CSSED10-310 bacterium]